MQFDTYIKLWLHFSLLETRWMKIPTQEQVAHGGSGTHPCGSLSAHSEMSRSLKSSLRIHKPKIFSFQRTVANYQPFSLQHKQITQSVYINQWLRGDPAAIYFLTLHLQDPWKQAFYLALVLRANSSDDTSEWQHVRTLPAQSSFSSSYSMGEKK